MLTNDCQSRCPYSSGRLVLIGLRWIFNMKTEKFRSPFPRQLRALHFCYKAVRASGNTRAAAVLQAKADFAKVTGLPRTKLQSSVPGRPH